MLNVSVPSVKRAAVVPELQAKVASERHGVVRAAVLGRAKWRLRVGLLGRLPRRRWPTPVADLAQRQSDRSGDLQLGGGSSILAFVGVEPEVALDVNGRPRRQAGQSVGRLAERYDLKPLGILSTDRDHNAESYIGPAGFRHSKLWRPTQPAMKRALDTLHQRMSPRAWRSVGRRRARRLVGLVAAFVGDLASGDGDDVGGAVAASGAGSIHSIASTGMAMIRPEGFWMNSNLRESMCRPLLERRGDA